MLLAIDVGNTNVVFALVADGNIRARWRIATDPRRTADEYAVWLLQLLRLEGLEIDVVDAVIVATVVPRALHNISVLSEKYFGVAPLVAGAGGAKFEMRVDLPDPDSVGADRLVNALAAHRQWPGDLIVIDFGTATTFDVVDYEGAYKGGVISPGVNLSLDALVNATAKLPRIAIAAPPKGARVMGQTTEEAMLSGIFWGYVAMMEGMVARLKVEIGRPVTVIATGGLAALFDDRTDVFDHIAPELTIDGLNMIYEMQKEKNT